MFEKIEIFLPLTATDIVKGLKYLHLKEVVHRDLKPANVQISNHHYRNSVSTEERNKVFWWIKIYVETDKINFL